VAPDADGAERELGVVERLAPGAFVLMASEGGRPYDEEALYLALRAGARYVGLLASRQRAALLVASMLRREVPLNEIKKRLRSPMGLDIGAKTAGEIAVSALAEAVMELRGGTGGRCRRSKAPTPSSKRPSAATSPTDVRLRLRREISTRQHRSR
jgi:xanthine dehydrogenase accessory factor